MACLGITGAMRTVPTEVLFEVPQLHLPLEAEARTGIYRLYCSDQWKPKSEGFGHIHDSGHEITQPTNGDKYITNLVHRWFQDK
jgi:hypothetical protein